MKILIMLLLGLGAQVLEAAELTIGTDPWCPYNCKEGDKPGIVIELFTKAFEKKGHKVKVRYMPWSRAVLSLKQGKTTTFGSANKKDAPELIYSDVPTVYMENTFFKKEKDSWTYKDKNSLEAGKIGVIDNYNYDLL